MVTDVPGLAGFGETDATAGGATSGLLRSTDIPLELAFGLIISGFPSPSMSPTPSSFGVSPIEKVNLVARELVEKEPLVAIFLYTATEGPSVSTTSALPSPSMSVILRQVGLEPVAMSTLVANEPALIVPLVAVFLKTESVAAPLLDTASSALPSPSMSPIITPKGVAPVAKSTFAANELLLITPAVVVLRNTETLPEPLLDTAKSSLPSPSISPIAIFSGFVPTVKSTFAANEPDVTAPLVAVFLNTEMLPAV